MTKRANRRTCWNATTISWRRVIKSDSSLIRLPTMQTSSLLTSPSSAWTKSAMRYTCNRARFTTLWRRQSPRQCWRRWIILPLGMDMQLHNRKICVEQCIPNESVPQSMYIFKQAKIGSAVTPHQDSTFLHTAPKQTVIGTNSHNLFHKARLF